MATLIPIAVRSSIGINFESGPPQFGPFSGFTEITSKSCRTMLFSPNGQYFSYVDGSVMKIVRTDKWEEVATISGTKAYHLAFSPKSTYLLSWEPFVVNSANPQGSPNLNIYKSENGELVKSFVQKKQFHWEPQWTADEKLFSRLVNTDVVFYESDNFEKIVTRINAHKVASYSISPLVGSYYILCYTSGSSGQPSIGRLYKYPDFTLPQTLANKSFFQADKVDYYWNPKGTSALLMTMTEVDKTGGSYYGKQGLHFIGTNGQTAMVTLSKEGPIYSVAWSPKGLEFCAIYGFMPSRATLFNTKCEPIFEFGTGPRNSIYYNPHGNILLLGGFGNLRGHIELWNVATKKLIGDCEAPDSTHVEWAPDGIHFLTATTAPRLRIGNGFKIWHYCGSLLFEKPSKDAELYEVSWKTYPEGVFREPTINAERIEGIASNQPQASKQVYRPPSARNRVIKFSLHDDQEDAHKPGGEKVPSKAAIKQKKKREAKKAKQQDETEKEPPVVSNVEIKLTGDLETDKKIKNIKKKLDAIEKLKAQKAQGKALEINQVAKINTENELLEELRQLQL